MLTSRYNIVSPILIAGEHLRNGADRFLCSIARREWWLKWLLKLNSSKINSYHTTENRWLGISQDENSKDAKITERNLPVSSLQADYKSAVDFPARGQSLGHRFGMLENISAPFRRPRLPVLCSPRLLLWRSQVSWETLFSNRWWTNRWANFS